jgi:general secretion pathway protein J
MFERRARGFTLIEVLVAVFITVIMVTMGYGAINQALNDRDALATRAERLREVQTTMRVMAQDFAQLAPRPVRQPVGDGWLPSLQAEPGAQTLVTFTRAGWANPAGIQRPALQRVAYVFENGKLRREHWTVLDATLSNTVIRRELLGSVRTVTIRYMDVGRNWREQWPIPGPSLGVLGEDRSRPVAIEVTLDLEDWGKVVRIFEVPS